MNDRPKNGGPVKDSWTDMAGAVERTRLSWWRTALSALAVALLAVFKVVLAQTRPGAVLACLMAVAWLGILGIARHRGITLRNGRRINRSPALLALVTAGYAVLAAALIL
jgi:uncharacterized membrane protein YidH (DUF202 family)